MGGFTKGFNPKIFGFADYRLRKKELALRERALDSKLEKEAKLKESKPIKSTIKPDYADKFSPANNKLMEDLYVFAADNASSLDVNNTANDDIPGAYDAKIAAQYKQMELQIMAFAAYGKDYVTKYKDYRDKVYEQDEHLYNVYNIDMVKTDDVYLTESMVQDNMGDDQNASDYAWLWNGDGTANDDGMGQQTPMMENGEYVYEQGADGQRYLLGKNGKRLVSYSKDKNSGAIEKTIARNPDGTPRFTFETVYNTEYNSDLIGFDGSGNIVYGEEGNKKSFVEVWDRDFLALDKYKISTNGFWEIGKGLTDFDIIRDEVGGGTNQYMTSESIDSMWAQAEAVSEFNNSTDRWNNEHSLIAAKMVAEEIAIKLGNTNPTEEYLQDIVNKIMLGNKRNNEGELINPGAQLPDSLRGVYEHSSNLKIDTYSDFMTSKIIDTWIARHAMKDIRRAQTQSGVLSGPYALDYNTAFSKNTEIVYADGTKGNSTASGLHTLNKAIKNKPLSWQPTNFDTDGNAIVNSVDDVGFVSFNDALTSILQKGGAQGELTSGNNSHRVIDKRTGKLMDGAKWDKANQQYVFNTQEDAENGLIVAGLEGFWKPKNPDDIRKMYRTTEGGTIDQPDRATIEEILNNENGIQGFFPLNQSTMSVDQLKYYKGVLEKARTIKKVIIKGDSFEEFTMNDNGDIIEQPFVMPGAQNA